MLLSIGLVESSSDTPLSPVALGQEHLDAGDHHEPLASRDLKSPSRTLRGGGGEARERVNFINEEQALRVVPMTRSACYSHGHFFKPVIPLRKAGAFQLLDVLHPVDDLATPADRLDEEPACGLSVPPWREEDVDDLPELVDRPEQAAPGPADLQVRLIDVPAIPDQMLSSSCGLGELRREALDPAVDRDVVDLGPALGQELLDVPVGEAEPQEPADRQGDDFGWETVPGEGRTPRQGVMKALVTGPRQQHRRPERFCRVPPIPETDPSSRCSVKFSSTRPRLLWPTVLFAALVGVLGRDGNRGGVPR